MGRLSLVACYFPKDINFEDLEPASDPKELFMERVTM
jgi:hypothetical protein